MTRTKRCCICSEVFVGYGHNPDPLGDVEKDRCCDRCNRDAVIPARLAAYAETPSGQTDVDNMSISVEGNSEDEILDNVIIGTVNELGIELEVAAARLVMLAARAAGTAAIDERDLKRYQRTLVKIIRIGSDDIFRRRVTEATREKAGSPASALN
jgi:hypothetical protein